MTHSSESMIWSQAEFTMLTFRRFSIFFSLSPSLPRSPTFNSTKMLSSRNVCFTRSILRRARIHLTHTHANMYKWILSTQKIIYTYYIRQYIHRVFFSRFNFPFSHFHQLDIFPAEVRMELTFTSAHVSTHTDTHAHFTATNDVQFSECVTLNITYIEWTSSSICNIYNCAMRWKRVLKTFRNKKRIYKILTWRIFFFSQFPSISFYMKRNQPTQSLCVYFSEIRLLRSWSQKVPSLLHMQHEFENSIGCGLRTMYKETHNLFKGGTFWSEQFFGETIKC